MPTTTSSRKFKHEDLAALILLPGESQARFEDLVDDLLAEYRPLTIPERMQVNKMAIVHWRLMRTEPAFATTAKHQTELRRLFNSALRALKSMQSHRNPASQVSANPPSLTRSTFPSDPSQPGKRREL